MEGARAVAEMKPWAFMFENCLGPPPCDVDTGTILPNVPFESSPVCAVSGLPARAPEDRSHVITDTASDGRKGISVIKLREVMMILDLHR